MCLALEKLGIKPFLARWGFERFGPEYKQKCLSPHWDRRYQTIGSYYTKTASQSKKIATLFYLYLYGKTINICNYLDLLLVLPFCAVIFCLPHRTHYVEHCRILPDNAEYGSIYSGYIIHQNLGHINKLSISYLFNFITINYLANQINKCYNLIKSRNSSK